MASLCRKGTSCDLIFLHKKKKLNNNDISDFIKSFVLNDDILGCLVVT